MPLYYLYKQIKGIPSILFSFCRILVFPINKYFGFRHTYDNKDTFMFFIFYSFQKVICENMKIGLEVCLLSIYISNTKAYRQSHFHSVGFQFQNHNFFNNFKKKKNNDRRQFFRKKGLNIFLAYIYYNLSTKKQCISIKLQIISRV